MKAVLNALVRWAIVIFVLGSKSIFINRADAVDAELVLGLWQPQQSFEYGIVVGSFNTKRYLKLMNWQAKLAAEHLAHTEQITVIIQDGASFHTSRVVQQQW